MQNSYFSCFIFKDNFIFNQVSIIFNKKKVKRHFLYRLTDIFHLKRFSFHYYSLLWLKTNPHFKINTREGSYVVYWCQFAPRCQFNQVKFIENFFLISKLIFTKNYDFFKNFSKISTFHLNQGTWLCYWKSKFEQRRTDCLYWFEAASDLQVTFITNQPYMEGSVHWILGWSKFFGYSIWSHMLFRNILPINSKKDYKMYKRAGI